MKSMITMLLLASTLLAVRYPRFNAMYMVTFNMYSDLVLPVTYRGETRLYIGEGYDSTTGEYCDFFAGDSCWYPLTIETTILELDMAESSLDYAFQNNPESESVIRIYNRNGFWRIGSSTYDTILESGDQVCPYRSYLVWTSNSILSVGDILEHTEQYEAPQLMHLGPNYRKNFLVITKFEPTVQIVRVPAKRVGEVETYRPLVDLLGRGSKLLLPGVFVSPHAPVLRIQRGP